MTENEQFRKMDAGQNLGSFRDSITKLNIMYYLTCVPASSTRLIAEHFGTAEDGIPLPDTWTAKNTFFILLAEIVDSEDNIEQVQVKLRNLLPFSNNAYSTSVMNEYLCAKLPQHCKRFKVQEVRPFNVTLLLRIQRCKLSQNFLLLLICQVLIKLLLGCKVAVLQQLIWHQAWFYSSKKQVIKSDPISFQEVFQIWLTHFLQRQGHLQLIALHINNTVGSRLS